VDESVRGKGGSDEQALHENEEALNGDVMDALVELIKYAGNLGQAIGARFGLTGSDVMALHKLDAPISMKELSQRLGCDASFVTVIADTLEKHGLARREPSLLDRRSKNIVLTEQGRAVQAQVTREVTARMPWCNALAISERQCFLGMLRKMLRSTEKGGEPVTAETATSS
jgi:DNA-binding MarR family transcriptional regulator